MSEVELQRRIEQLERQLAESQKMVRALARPEIDSLAHGAGSTPVVMHAAQDKLRANEQLLRAVFEGSLDAMLIADNEGRYVDANPAACELFGLTKDELIGRSIAEFADHGYVATTTFRQFLDAGRMRGDFPLRRPDGERRHLDFSAVANVLPGLHLAVLRDLTAHDAAERALEEAQERLRTVIANAPIVLFALDREGRYTLYEGARGFHALGRAAPLGDSAFADFGRLPGAHDVLRRALAGETALWEGQVDGAFFEVILVPVRDRAGVVSAVTGVAIDVSSRKSAESALRASEARFRAMIENGDEAIWLVDAGGEVLYASPSTRRVLGVVPEELTGKLAHDLVNESDREVVRTALAALVAHAPAERSVELRLKHSDGSDRWMECAGSNMLAEPAVRALVWNIRDATDRKRAEAALHESQRMLEDAQEVAHLGSWAAGADVSDPISWSAECARIFGCERADAPTVEQFIEKVHEGDRARVIEQSQRAAQQGVPFESEHRILLPGGDVRWVYSRAVIEGAVLWSSGKPHVAFNPRTPYRVVGVVQDITERKRVETELRASEERYRRIVNNTSEGVWMYDANGVTTFMNPRMAEMLGCSVEEAVGKPIFDFMDETAEREARERVARRLQGLMDRGEFRLVRTDGSDLWVSLHAQPLFDHVGHFESSLGLATDITERRRADQTRNHLAAIVESSDDAIISTNLLGVLTSWNRGAESLFGYSALEAVGQPIVLLLPTGRSDEEDDMMRTVARGESIRHYETQRQCKDGTLLDVSLSVSPIRGAEGELVGASKIIRNISDRRRAEEARNRLAAIVASSDDAIVSRSVDGIIRTWNRGAESLTQYTAEEAVGQPIGMLCAPEAPWHRPDLDGDDAAHRTREARRQFESLVLRKDGSLVDVSITSSTLTDDQGKLRGASIIARDISVQRRAQAALRRSEEQLRQAQKMEAIGSLAGGVAHDFNNLLSVILSYTSLIVKELKPSDPIRADLEEVHKAGMRATQLTRQLLAFSRQQMLQPVVLDLNQVVLGIESMLRRLLREDIELSLLMSPAAGKVHADPGQVEQVIMNLVVNGRDAMAHGGKLTIETTNVTIDESYAMYHAGVKPGPYVLMAVTDTGVGMDAATRERIFEPFFTTKEKSKGTGLGLSTVYGIVQQSGGHIWVYSEVDKGTSFKVYLPRTDREIETVAAPAPLVSVRGSETILLVEDEAQVRVIMRSILRRQGYNVLEAQNGGEAFLLCEQFTAKIHLLLTDVVMPRMSGRQLAERLTLVRPEMRVLYVSGYTENTIVHHGVLDAGIEFLQKPIMPDELLRKVRQMLDGRSPSVPNDAS